MRSLVFVSAVGFAVASCTPVEPPGVAFARETAGRIPGPPQSCVATFPAQNLRVIDSSTLAYGYGRQIYVNHLPGPCPGIEPLNTIIVHAYGTEYCRGDRVQGREPGAIIPGPQCVLGDWVPYTMR